MDGRVGKWIDESNGEWIDGRIAESRNSAEVLGPILQNNCELPEGLRRMRDKEQHKTYP